MTSVPAVVDLVMQVQGDFLETPHLRLTPSQAAARFGLDRPTCRAILDALADSNVLEKKNDGAYTRFLPREIGQHTTSTSVWHAA